MSPSITVEAHQAARPDGEATAAAANFCCFSPSLSSRPAAADVDASTDDTGAFAPPFPGRFGMGLGAGEGGGSLESMATSIRARNHY